MGKIVRKNITEAQDPYFDDEYHYHEYMRKIHEDEWRQWEQDPDSPKNRDDELRDDPEIHGQSYPHNG